MREVLLLDISQQVSLSMELKGEVGEKIDLSL